MKSISFALLFATANFAFAQTPAATMLPDGSADMYVGAGLISEPSCEYGGEQKTRLMPNVQMQWSNGVFLRNTSLGWHLNKGSDIEFGPLLEYQRGCNASAARKLAGFGDVDASFQLGGFLNYFPVQNLRLSSKLLLGTGAGRKTGYLNLEARSYHKLASHHGLALSTGLIWSKRYYDQSGARFDPDMYITSGVVSGSSNGMMPGFDAPRIKETLAVTNADVRNAYVGVNWNWEFSSSWMLTSHVTAAHQFDSDKNSLWLGKRNYVTVYSGFAYRF